MRELIFRRRVWAVVMASGFAAACDSQPPETGIPAPCNAAPLADYVLFPSLLSPARGSVTGSEIAARLCAGGASAYLQRTTPTTSPPNQLLMEMGSYSVDPKRDYRIALPTDATRFQLSVSIGLGAAQPGTYSNGSVCGSIILCAMMPVPVSVHCPATLQSDVCPAQCAISGSAPACVPIEPTVCYEATSVPCIGGNSRPESSWRLTLSSVEPYAGSDGGAPETETFMIHGSLDAKLVKIITGDPGATATSTANLSLSF